MVFGPLPSTVGFISSAVCFTISGLLLAWGGLIRILLTCLYIKALNSIIFFSKRSGERLLYINLIRGFFYGGGSAWTVQ